jgi:hypothetical protein
MLLKLTTDNGFEVKSLEQWAEIKEDGQSMLVGVLRVLDKDNLNVELVTVENVISSYNQFYRELHPKVKK